MCKERRAPAPCLTYDIPRERETRIRLKYHAHGSTIYFVVIATEVVVVVGGDAEVGGRETNHKSLPLRRRKTQVLHVVTGRELRRLTQDDRASSQTSGSAPWLAGWKDGVAEHAAAGSY